jgi:hypothetical protein
MTSEVNHGMEIISWTLANGALTIVLPYRDAEQLTPVWAEAENDIDLRRQARLAGRCAMAFAAMELRRYLARTVPGLEVRFASRPPRDGYALILDTVDPDSRADAFSLIPEGGQRLRIIGKGRAGTLFGVYRFLGMQGWRWLAPGDAGEVAPEPGDRLSVPSARIDECPGLDAGRGFDMEYASMESAALLLWAARNGLNVWAGREATLPLAHKLGMTIKRGGHIFEKLLHPDVLLPDGRTLWDAHPDWFGLPADGARRREAAQRTQFCVSQPDLFEYLGTALVRRLRGEWADADRVDVWGFDTWGQICQCPECRAIGNAGDAMLVMASRLREVLDRAEAAGELDRHVTLILCAYEGTASLDDPSRSVPANLAADGTLVTFYPINRCYQHTLDDAGCETNARYWKALNAWTAARPALRIVMGEYYNVSKFEDLPLLFTDVMTRDWPAYAAAGVRGATYMHIPTLHWGLRTLTQNLYARLTWTPSRATAEALIADYFPAWYGDQSARLEQAYARVEQAWGLSAQWRAWAPWSALSQLSAWDGTSPKAPLALHPHLGGTAAAVGIGRDALAALREALDGVRVAKQAERLAAARQAPPLGTAVNPAELRRLQQGSRVVGRLAEDLRLVQYGVDVLELTVALLAYHEALRTNPADLANAVWNVIEATADRLEQYIVPIDYEWPTPGLVAKDGLQRSQVGPLVERCRAFRLRDTGPRGDVP